MTSLYGRNSSITWMTASKNQALANRERSPVVMRVLCRTNVIRQQNLENMQGHFLTLLSTTAKNKHTRKLANLMYS